MGGKGLKLFNGVIWYNFCVPKILNVTQKRCNAGLSPVLFCAII